MPIMSDQIKPNSGAISLFDLLISSVVQSRVAFTSMHLSIVVY